MKKSHSKRLMVGVLAFLATFIFAGCQNSDTDIKGDIATKAEQDKNFAGVRFTVENGIVNLAGECPTEKAKTTVETTVKGIYGVINVENNIRLAPVVIGTDQQLKQSVDSVLKKYAGAQALVRDSVVVLQGQVKQNEVQKLTAAIATLQPKRVENNLSVKQSG